MSANSPGYYFDRNVTLQSQSFFGQAIAPHANTTRWTYTVPSGITPYGRRAVIEHYEILFAEDVVATTATQPDMATILASGVVLARVPFLTNVVQSSNMIATQAQVVCAPGDVITSTSIVSNTGGSFTIGIFASIKEFS